MSSILIDELNEIKKLRQKLSNGTITVEEASAQKGLFDASRDRLKLAMDIGVRLGNDQQKNDVARMLLCDNTMITNDYENEQITCPLRGSRKIERSKCLELSGEEKNQKTCATCDNFNETRNLLLQKQS